jgi:hypothetical protein
MSRWIIVIDFDILVFVDLNKQNLVEIHKKIEYKSEYRFFDGCANVHFANRDGKR